MFDSSSLFSFPKIYCGKNVVSFNVDNSSSVYIDNKKKCILILGKDPIQELGNTTTLVEALLLQ